MTREDSSTARSILVLGVGNEFRNDDGIGVIIARRLEHLALPDVAIAEIRGEGGELMEAFSRADSVIVVDAVSSNADPGTIVRFNARDQKIPTDFFHYSSHAFSLAESIELAKVLGSLPPQCVVFGIEGLDFSSGTTISHPVSGATERLMSVILEEIESLRSVPAACA